MTDYLHHSLPPECGPMYWHASIVVFPFIADNRWFLRLDHTKRSQQQKEDQSNNQKESPGRL